MKLLKRIVQPATAVFIGFTSLGFLLVIYPIAGPVPTKVLALLIVAAGLWLSLAIFRSRARSGLLIEELRLQNAHCKSELETVLISTEEANRSLATSMAIGQRITSILDLNVLLNQVADLIQERFQAYYVGIFLIDDSGEYAISRAGSGEAGRRLTEEGFRLKVGQEGVVGWVAERRHPARVDDVDQDSRYIPLQDIPHTKSELALPLEMGATLLGVLDIQSERESAFREDDVPFLQMVADQVAIAIKNASLYQAEKSRRRLAEILYQVGRVLSGTLDLSEVLDQILQQLSEIVHYDRAAVMLKREDSLEIAASHGFPASGQNLRVSIKENDVFEEIYQTQQPLHLPDVSLRPDWQHAENMPRARAWLGIPLIRQNQVIGMLSLTREALEAFSEEEITLASTFANQSAIALHNAQLYEEITRFNQELEDRVRQRTVDLQDAYDRLERLDKTKSDFISIASHELRTPLTVIQGYSQMMMDDAGIQQNEAYRQLAAGIHSGAQRLGEIVNTFIDAAKIDSQVLQINPVPVVFSTLVENITSGLKKSFEERKQTLEVKDLGQLPVISADKEGLKKVFYQLVVNAIKYTPDGGKITISGRYLDGGPDGCATEIVVEDTGIGIDPEIHDLIFTKFYQSGTIALHSSSRDKFKGGGPGLGLAIARGIIEAHGGRIWVESAGFDEKTCPGSKFHILLPINQ